MKRKAFDLPIEMATLESVVDWTLDLQNTLSDLLGSTADRRAVVDFLESMDSEITTSDTAGQIAFDTVGQIAFLTARWSPEEVYYAWA